MIKIVELTTRDFLTGESENAYGGRGGIFYEAIGINPIVNPAGRSTDLGLLQTAAAPVRYSASVVVDIPIASAHKATGSYAGKAFFLGNAGHFYQIDLSNNSISDLRTTTISNLTNGLEIFKTFAFYTQKTKVGRWNTTSSHPTNWSDSFMTGLQDYNYHPTHQFGDKVWIGDKNRMAKIIDSRTLVTGSDILDFPSDYRVMDVDDDGLKLVIGITKNLGDVSIGGNTKVIFWDTNSPSWNREWPLPEPNVVSLNKVGAWNYAITTTGVYRFTYSIPPKKVNSNLTAIYGRSNITDVFYGSMLICGNRGGSISVYGSPLPGYPMAHYRIATGWGAGQGVTVVNAQAKRGIVYFGTNNSRLYSQSVSVGGDTGRNARTAFISLPEQFRVQEAKLIMGTKLTSSDRVEVAVRGDVNNIDTTMGAASFTTHSAVTRISLRKKSVVLEDVQLNILFSGGNPKIRKIQLWGEPYRNAES